MSRIIALCEWLLRRAIVWGCVAYFAFYVLVVQSAGPESLAQRYFAGGAAGIKGAVALVFFVAMAALAMRLFKLVVEYGGLEHAALPALAPEDCADAVGNSLPTSEQSVHRDYFGNRINRALVVVRQRSGIDSLHAHLDRLAGADRHSMGSHYAAIRLAAFVMLLLGACAAAAAVQSGAAPADQTNTALSAGLGVGLDAAIQAAVLTALLLAAKFGVERFELRLLAAVDARTERELLGRFRHWAPAAEPSVASIQQMCEKVLSTVDSAVARHDSSVVKSVIAASRQWEETAAASATLLHRIVGEALTEGLAKHAQLLNEGVDKHTADLERTLIRHAEILSEGIDQHTAALADGLEHHAAVMTETEKALAAENRRNLSEVESALGEAMVLAATRQEKLIETSEDLLKQVQAALSAATGASVAQQEQLARQGETLLQVVEATGQVRQLEHALNDNLASLNAAHHFEETMAGLSAALQLLSANLGRSASARGVISLDSHETKNRAA